MSSTQPAHSGRAVIVNLEGPREVVGTLTTLLGRRGRFSVSHAPEESSDFSRSRLEFAPERSPPTVVLLVVGKVNPDRVDRVLDSLEAARWKVPVLFIVDRNLDPDRLQTWLRRTVSDFLSVPLQSSALYSRISQLTGRTDGDEGAVGRLYQKLGLAQLVGESPPFVDEVRKIPLIARCDAGVLIQGETGTGKELVARSIHYLSFRSGHPFVPVSCGGIPTDLVENELFGHVKGAFTGASIDQKGLIADADGGTLLLDDVDCLAPTVQAKLLRFLQEKEYRVLGSPRLHRADVRVISSCNTDLDEALRQGRFRLDLYHRLNVIPVALPPLRRRTEDILRLAHHFLRKYTEDLHLPMPRIPASVKAQLLHYDWPGNVRELKHVMERTLILSRGRRLEVEHLMLPQADEAVDLGFQDAKARVVRRFERRYLERKLVAHNGNITRAAKASGKNRRAFFELIRKHHIDVDRFRRMPLP